VEPEILIGRIADSIINPFLFLLMGVAFLYFIYGVIRYIVNAADDTKRKEGQKHMMWGIIGLTIMVGAWGLVRLISNTLTEVSGEPTLYDEYRNQP
jgi:hypothetical protein